MKEASFGMPITSPNDPEIIPDYWWAEEIETGKVTPIELWRMADPRFNDSVVVFGDTGGYDAKFWRLIEPIMAPSRAA